MDLLLLHSHLVTLILQHQHRMHHRIHSIQCLQRQSFAANYPSMGDMPQFQFYPEGRANSPMPGRSNSPMPSRPTEPMNHTATGPGRTNSPMPGRSKSPMNHYDMPAEPSHAMP